MKAIITGASSGMGKYFAIELAKRGYDIIVVARREHKLQELVSKIQEETQQEASYEVMDLTDRNQVLRLGEIIKHDPEINFLANNAGVGYFGHAVEMDETRVENLVKLNVNALTTLTIIANKAFAYRSGGKILNVSSVAKFINSFPCNAPYTASKHYVDVFSRSINYENQQLQNRVKIISLRPGAIKTEWSAHAAKQQNSNSDKQLMFAMAANKFAHKVIEAVFKGKTSITKGPSGWTLKLLSKLPLAFLMKRLMYKIGKSLEN